MRSSPVSSATWLLALHRDDPVVDLARQQPQRKADDARRMAAHPLDREVGLAGVGGPENGPDRCVGTRAPSITNVAARAPSARFLRRADFRAVLTSDSGRFRGAVLTAKPRPRRFWPPIGQRPRASGRLQARRAGRARALLALLCSGVAWASLPRVDLTIRTDEQRQWHALAIAPLSGRRHRQGCGWSPTDAVEPVDFVPKRRDSGRTSRRNREAGRAGPDRGRCGSAGAPATGFTGRCARRARRRRSRRNISPRWRPRSMSARSRRRRHLRSWSLAATARVPTCSMRASTAPLDTRPAAGPLDGQRPQRNGSMPPTSSGRLRSSRHGVAGRRPHHFLLSAIAVHPILRFTRFHGGVDFGASWGSPIVAAADGQVAGAGWAGGYGRQVRIAHGGGIVTSYSHMS